MIVNRTQLDVDKARQIREEKIKLDKNGKPKNSEPLTADEELTLEKGMLTINTLNRIENKQSELVNMINSLGYWNTNILNKTWSLGDIFNESDFNRILKNENNLINAFFVYNNTPELPNMFLNYIDANSVEKILYDFDTIINDIKVNYRECGNYTCGED